MPTRTQGRLVNLHFSCNMHLIPADQPKRTLSWVLSHYLHLFSFFGPLNLHYTETDSLDISAQCLIPIVAENSKLQILCGIPPFCSFAVYWWCTWPLLQSGFFFCCWPTTSSKTWLPVKALPVHEVHHVLC